MDFIIPGLAGMAIGFFLGWLALSGRIGALAARLKETSGMLATMQSERTEYHERAVTAETQLSALEARLKEREEQLRLEFKDTANSVFKTISKEFSTQSEKQLTDILNPLRERIVDFQKLVTDSFTTQGKEQHTLKAEIEKIVLQTDSLTKALRGDVKAQGNWGEIMLERILEESGLQKGIGYTVQGSDMGLAGSEGNRLRPDVIVHLPDEKHVIIDSKVSLTAYERYCADNEGDREIHIKDFLRSVRAHVGLLEQKRYQDIDKLGTPDFVLMFMPIEGAYSFAIQHDPELQSYAWGKRVAIVCPTTLFVTLRTIASVWRVEMQNRNAQEIARQGGALYDKFVGFIEDMQKIGTQVTRVQQAYDDAMSKLKEGTGNLVKRAEDLRKLGIKTSKGVPKELIASDEDAA